MSNFVLLGLNVNLGNIKRVKVENCNFESEIKELKHEASKQSDSPPETLELVHQGRVLNEEKTLKDYAVKSGDVVYVLKKYIKPREPAKPPRSSSLFSDIHGILLSQNIRIGSLTSFINVLEGTFNPSNITKFLEIAPELEDEHVALSFLASPELLYSLQIAEDFDDLNKEHPVLAPAFIKICRSLLKIEGIFPIHTGRLHHVESEEEYEDADLMDPEEYDDDDSDNQGGENLITQEQLAQALAMARAATGSNSANNSVSGPSSSSATNIDTGLREFLGSLLSRIDSTNTPSNSGTPSRPLITHDMISSALSQAISSVSNPSTSEPTSASASASASGETASAIPTTFTPSESPTMQQTPSESNFTEQLKTMQEMGLKNRRQNLRALIVSNGDVNAAINLVFSGAIDD